MNELERYKSNFIYNAVQKRIFMEIIEISDKVADIMKVANAEGSKEDLIKHIESLRKQFDQLFINQGIEKIESKSDLFDGQVQEATDTVSTNVKEENQKVVEVLKEGYRFDQKLIRPQKVVVKKYTN
jgi:molecular chaperone GrpE (heat shock protein)